MGLTDRIRDLAAARGESLASVEKKVGIGNGTIRKWDVSSPSVAIVKKVADFLSTTVDYLITGEEPVSAQDREFLTLLHSLPAEEQRDFLGTVRVLAKMHQAASSELDP